MIQKLKNLWGLIESGEGLWLFLRLGLWIALVSVLLYLISLPSLLKLLTPKRASGKRWPREKLVNFISFWLGRERAFYSRSCLKRSLILYRYLNLQGEKAQFCIGVKKEDDQLKAHSWLMVGEEKLFPEEDLSYKIIFRYPISSKSQRPTSEQ